MVEKSISFPSTVGTGEGKVYKFGKVVFLCFEITLSKEIQPWGEEILRIPKGYIPIQSLYLTCGGYGTFIYGGDSGVIVLNGNGGKIGETIAGAISYLVE